MLEDFYFYSFMPSKYLLKADAVISVQNSCKFLTFFFRTRFWKYKMKGFVMGLKADKAEVKHEV